MRLLQLPRSLLLALWAHLCQAEADQSKTSTRPQVNRFNATSTFFSAANGTGAAYATACADARSAFAKAKSSWDAIHNTVQTTTQLLGGTSFAHLTYYENATTLCDGHPRVLYSPAVSLSESWTTMTGPITGTTIITDTMGSFYPAPSPSCTVAPPDCDGLWSDYSESVAAAATITPAPEIKTPFCMNQTAAASQSSVTKEIYGCGLCTIYGEGVELVYFPVPTTVSRDMCATTPSASLTSYGTGAVLEAYAGKSFGANVTASSGGPRTAVVDGHTFTTGTAYISISKVYAVDRCHNTYGTVVNDAILAMPSESVLSLRYSQDKYQRLMETDAITGYPVSYADFNTPIPWSAWIGQNQCVNQFDTITCGVIYESTFRPQLAIPPEITSLSPDFVGCQMWYNGLWDPPLALTEAESAAGPTLPGGGGISKSTSAAKPSQTPAAPTSQPTALSNELPSTPGGYGPTLPNAARTSVPATSKPAATQASPAASGKAPSAESYSAHAGGELSSATSHAAHAGSELSSAASYAAHAGGELSSAASHAAHAGSELSSAASHAAHSSHSSDSNNNSDHNAGSGANAGYGSDTKPKPKKYVPTAEPWTKDFTIGGSKYVAKAGNKEAVIGTVTCVVDGPAQTLSDGTVCSYGKAGLTFDIKTSVLYDAPATARPSTAREPDNSAENTEPPSGVHSHFGANPTRTGDADIATITINGEVETLVQENDGGPIVLDGTITLKPGGEPTTLPGGHYISVAADGGGFIFGSRSTLGVEPMTTAADDSISSAIRSGIGYGNDSDDASSTSSADATTADDASASSTGAAMTLASFEAFNVAAVVAILMAAAVI